MKTFIRRPGNKSRYLKYILPHIPSSYNTYFEPFLGSGALFLRLQPDKWIINDVNNDIINTWTFVKSCPGEIIGKLNSFAEMFVDTDQTERENICKLLLNKFDIIKNPEYRAVLFIILTFSIYGNTIIRRGKYYFAGLEKELRNKGPVYFLSKRYFDLLNEVSRYLNHTNGKIYNQDYKKVMNKAKKGDFVFLDPPYIEANIDYQFQYNIGEKLDNGFQTSFIEEVNKLNAKGVKFIITQPDTPTVRDMFRNYNISSYTVVRRHQQTRQELVIKNFN